MTLGKTYICTRNAYVLQTCACSYLVRYLHTTYVLTSKGTSLVHTKKGTAKQFLQKPSENYQIRPCNFYINDARI